MSDIDLRISILYSDYFDPDEEIDLNMVQSLLSGETEDEWWDNTVMKDSYRPSWWGKTK